MKVLIDNGHGHETLGKRSPDGELREYKWTRDVAREIVLALSAEGYDADLLVPETYDVDLLSRCRRANMYNEHNTVLVSIHCDAAGDGAQWHDARGWSCHVYKGAGKHSRQLATMLWEEAMEMGLNGNRWTPPTKYKESNLYILKRTNCPAVLTENLFMDNRADAAFLLSDEGKRAIVDLHVAAIKRYIVKFGG